MDFTGIRKARKKAGITQDGLASLLGINRATVSKYESGQIEPSLSQLGEIAKALNTTVYEMVGPDWGGWSSIDTSDAFKAEKKAPTPEGERESKKEELMAAFWGGEKDLSPEDLEAMWADVENFAAFVAEKKRREKQK